MPGTKNRSDAGESEALLVRTPVTDPVATLDTAPVDVHGGPVLAVLTTVSRGQFERGMAGAGYDPETLRAVEFEPNADAREGRVPSGNERVHGDIAGLSMALVEGLGGLGERGGVVYLESVEPFVAAVGLEPTLRFLVIVVARARAAGVTFVVRLDPDSVGSGVADTLAEAFDRTVDGPAGGSNGGAEASG